MYPTPPVLRHAPCPASRHGLGPGKGARRARRRGIGQDMGRIMKRAMKRAADDARRARTPWRNTGGATGMGDSSPNRSALTRPDASAKTPVPWQPEGHSICSRDVNSGRARAQLAPIDAFLANFNSFTVLVQPFQGKCR